MTFPEITKQWHDESNFLVLLSCADTAELLQLAGEAWQRGLRYTLFTEPDFPVGQQVTALAIEPGPETSRLCASLPLALRQEVSA